MKFLFYGTDVVHINQGFGENPEYYARFKDEFGNPETGHNGIDFMALHATPLLAPCDGTARYGEDAHGGAGIYIDTTDGTNKYRVILFHLCTKEDPTYKPLIPVDGSSVPVKTGQLIGYTDNSGAPFESSGDHLHFGLIPTDALGNSLFPRNGTNGCVDPTPYFTGYPASQVDKYNEILGKEVSTLTLIVALLRKLLGLK